MNSRTVGAVAASAGNCSLDLSEDENLAPPGGSEALEVSEGNCILGPSECGASDGSCSQLRGGVRYPIDAVVSDGMLELSGRSSWGTVAALDGICSW